MRGLFADSKSGGQMPERSPSELAEVGKNGGSVLRYFERPDETRNALHVVAAAPRSESGSNAFDRSRIGVASRSHLDRSGAGEKKLYNIFGGDDPPHPENRDGYGLGSFVDHAQGDRLDAWPGKTPRHVAQAGLAGFAVDRHGEEGVDEADRIRARIGCDSGHLGN